MKLPRTGMGRWNLVSVCEHHFCDNLLSNEAIVVDLGANRGKFSTTMASRYGARCYAVEPSSRLAGAIEESANVAVFNLAISDIDGEIRFAESENAEANTTLVSDDDTSISVVRCMRLDSFFAHIEVDRVDLLKIDIEGAETALFDSTSDDLLRRVGQITIEFHDFLPDMVTKQDVERICRRLEQLGFIVFSFSNTAHRDVLCINSTTYHPSHIGLAHLRVRTLGIRVANALRRVNSYRSRLWGWMQGRSRR